jgi:hypothetical protein
LATGGALVVASLFVVVCAIVRIDVVAMSASSASGRGNLFTAGLLRAASSLRRVWDFYGRARLRAKDAADYREGKRQKAKEGDAEHSASLIIDG